MLLRAEQKPRLNIVTNDDGIKEQTAERQKNDASQGVLYSDMLKRALYGK